MTLAFEANINRNDPLKGQGIWGKISAPDEEEGHFKGKLKLYQLKGSELQPLREKAITLSPGDEPVFQKWGVYHTGQYLLQLTGSLYRDAKHTDLKDRMNFESFRCEIDNIKEPTIKPPSRQK